MAERNWRLVDCRGGSGSAARSTRGWMASIATSRLNRLPAAESGITIGDFLVPIRVGERLSSRLRHVVLIVAGALYILLGLFLPVYANNRSGAGVIAGWDQGHLILGATGGYLIGFMVAAAVVGRLAEMGWDRHLLGAVAAMIAGNLVIYMIALPWL